MTEVWWLGWITMRGDDKELDNVLTNPNRWTKAHAFTTNGEEYESRRARCGVLRPAEENHLGFLYAKDGVKRCQWCAARCPAPSGSGSNQQGSQ